MIQQHLRKTLFLIYYLTLMIAAPVLSQESKRPNVLLILSDDQGYGDFGFTGNEIIQTPNLDRFANENTFFDQFYVNPVCTPSRAALMTGRYPQRTTAQWVGAMIPNHEVTIAEALKDAGYRTAIYGKWHIGHHYPMRPIDQGFDDAIIHNRGILTPPAGPPGNTYHDPMLMHNGIWKKFKGYCNDIYTDKAIDFMKLSKESSNPFFIYLATNLPHGPLQIDKKYWKQYADQGINENTARVYGMCTNIDENFGRLMSALKHLNIDGNTIVIYLSDNGPAFLNEDYYMAGLRGKKDYVYEGGIRTPCLWKWPEKIKTKQRIDRIAAHIDIMPTLLDACGVQIPPKVKLDGISLMPLLSGNISSQEWPDRYLFCQGYPTSAKPQINKCFMVRNQQYKLVQQEGLRDHTMSENLFVYELFNMKRSLSEKENIAKQYPAIVKKMKIAYQNWYHDVGKNNDYSWPRFFIGSELENPMYLYQYAGVWPNAEVIKSGKYDITAFIPDRIPQTDMIGHVIFGNTHTTLSVKAGSKSYKFENIYLEKGSGVLKIHLNQGGKLDLWPQGVKIEYLIDN